MGLGKKAKKIEVEVDDPVDDQSHKPQYLRGRWLQHEGDEAQKSLPRTKVWGLETDTGPVLGRRSLPPVPKIPRPEHGGGHPPGKDEQSVERTAPIGGSIVSARELTGVWYGYSLCGCHITTVVAHNDDTLSLANPACETCACCICCDWVDGDEIFGFPTKWTNKSRDQCYHGRAREFRRIGDGNSFAPTNALILRDGELFMQGHELGGGKKPKLEFQSAKSGTFMVHGNNRVGEDHAVHRVDKVKRTYTSWKNSDDLLLGGGVVCLVTVGSYLNACWQAILHGGGDGEVSSSSSSSYSERSSDGGSGDGGDGGDGG